MRNRTKWLKKSNQLFVEQAAETDTQQNISISVSLENNLEVIQKDLGGSSDIIIRKFSIGEDGGKQVAVLYTDGLVDTNMIQESILKTLMIDIRKVVLSKEAAYIKLSQIIEAHSLTGGQVNKIYLLREVKKSILSGDTIILINGEEAGLRVGTKGWEKRSVEEPSTQTVVRGPKEGFTETLRTNTSLLRRKIKDENLWIKEMQIGKQTNTDIAIAYIHGIANENVVSEVIERLKKVNVDSILDGAYLEEFIQDDYFTPFPTVYNTERPDSVAAGLLEGRVAILIDGSPFVLLVPVLFVQFLQSSEDYYQRADIATFLRLLRFFAFFLALLIPSLYIALTTFHPEMLPTTLLINITAQREGVPFPALVEAFAMEITFEILREAGLRMPRAIGSAISIVGALVLGQAAVEAGIVSAVMVIVVSLTAISNFVIPEYNLAISVRLLRFLFMILAATLGLFGIVFGLTILLSHLVSLRSFGIPYLYPLAPFNGDDQKDTFIRLPRWKLFSRPRLINQNNITRAKETKS